MKKFRLQRVNCTHAIIFQRMPDGDEKKISTELPYEDCMEFMHKNQKDINAYFITRTFNRQNAKRHLVKRIYCEDDNEAYEEFDHYLDKMPNTSNYELCTGNWKLLATRKAGMPIIHI